MPRRKGNPSAASEPALTDVPLAADGATGTERIVPVTKVRSKNMALDDESQRVMDQAEDEVARKLAGEKEVLLNADFPTRFGQAKTLWPMSRVRFLQILPVEDHNIPARRLDTFRDYDEVRVYLGTHWRQHGCETATYRWDIYEGSRRWTTGQIVFRAGTAVDDPEPEERSMNPNQNGGYPPGGGYPPQGYGPPAGPPIGAVQNGYQWNGAGWIWLNGAQPQAQQYQAPPPPQQPPPPQAQPVTIQYQPPPQQPPPPPNDELTMRLVGQLSEANARAARAEETNRSNEQRFAELERRFLGGAPVQQPQPAPQPQPQPAPQPQQPQWQQPQYAIGAVVNGHQFDGVRWVPLPPTPAATPVVPAVPPPDPLENMAKTFSFARMMMKETRDFATAVAPPAAAEPEKPEPPAADPFPMVVKDMGPFYAGAINGEMITDWPRNLMLNAGKGWEALKEAGKGLKDVLGERTKAQEDQNALERERINADTRKLAEMEKFTDLRRQNIELAERERGLGRPPQFVQAQPVQQQPPPPVRTQHAYVQPSPWAQPPVQAAPPPPRQQPRPEPVVVAPPREEVVEIPLPAPDPVQAAPAQVAVEEPVAPPPEDDRAVVVESAPS